MRGTPLTKALSAAAFVLVTNTGTGTVAAPVWQTQAPLEFAGTTPCGEVERAFLGGMDRGTACHAITWRLALATFTSAPASWTLTAAYGVPAPSNPNAMVDGPRVALKGTWTTSRGTKFDASAIIYRLTSEAGRTITFGRVSEELVHILDGDERLKLGTAGWSYTLNRADRMEKPGDPSLAPDMSYTISPRGSGTTVFAVLEGRTPCAGIARELKISPVTGCLKVKWRVTLFQNAQTGQPTTYKIESSLHRDRAREGRWRLQRGSPSDPRPVIYELGATTNEGPLRLLGSDDRVLFFQAQDGSLLVGNADFSYTLNRVGP
jgi:hypothetical protein